MLEVVWGRLAPLLPPVQRAGRPYTHDRRVVLEAIVYIMDTGCAWQDLPARFPPWKTVHSQLMRWRQAGIWGTIWSGLDQSDLQL